MNRRSVVRWVVWVGLLLLVGWAVASPFLALRGLQQAILSKDKAAIERYVDFERVRTDLTAQIREKVRQQLDANNQNSLGRLATMLSGGIINQVVNRVVTPEGLADFGADALNNQGQQGGVEAVRQWRLGLEWPPGLRIYNPQRGGAGLRMELQDWRWKVVAVNLG
ncbi:MAG: DUF2939 domain-containing protein [Meiothermus sp.]|nr:DUF2939 domain-containing protein [Meiothermus sp.]